MAQPIVIGRVYIHCRKLNALSAKHKRQSSSFWQVVVLPRCLSIRRIGMTVSYLKSQSLLYLA